MAGFLLRDTPVITAYFLAFTGASSSKVQELRGRSDLAHPCRQDLARLERRTGGRSLTPAARATGSALARYIAKRLGLAVITLVLLSMIIFAAAQLLPGDLGRSVLGRDATAEAVAEYNHEHGTDRSAVVQYLDWAGGVVRGDFGNSLVPPEQPVWDVIATGAPRTRSSSPLFAFVLVVPFGILGGVLSGLRVGKATDRGITVVGLSLAVVPEFVTGLVLILVFSIWAGWLPVTAQWEPGSGPLTQVKHLTLPAIALTLVLFGYVARITRAGVVEALDADYTRTAFLKGLPRKTVIRRHVLRNAILPTIAVIATQVGYLLGGLVAIELLFNYRGIGLTTLEAAQLKDYTVLSAGVLIIGFTYVVVTLVADVLSALLNPRIRFGASE